MFGQRINRVAPAMPAEAYKTYEVSAPLRTHWRPASCAEFECSASLRGWETLVDVSTDLGVQQAAYIRSGRSGRAYVEERRGDTLVAFLFKPGQPCFKTSEHRVAVGRPPLYVVRGGDWRGNPRGETPRVHTRPEDFVDDFATHQGRLADAIQEG